MSSQNNDTHPISYRIAFILIGAIRVFFWLTIWSFCECIRLFIFCCLFQLKIICIICIIGIPIMVMIYEWEKNTLNPALDKFFVSLYRILGVPEFLIGQKGKPDLDKI